MTWTPEFLRERFFDGQRQLAIGRSQVENRGQGCAQIRCGHFHPDGVDVGTNQIAVPDVDPRRCHKSGNHLVRFMEVILIMWAPSGAVGIDEGRLSTASGPATALRVIGRGGRNVAEIDEIQLGDVHAQFHRWRAEQQRQIAAAETVLAFLAVLRRDLGRVFPGFEDAFQIHETSVALDEVTIDLGRHLAHFQQARPVHRPNLAIGRQPTQGVRVDLVTGNVTAANLLDDAIAFEREQKEANDLIHLRATEVLRGWDMGRQRAFEVTTITAVGGNEEPGCVVALFGPGIGHHGFHQFARVFQIPDRILQQPRLGLLNQVELLLWIEHVHFDSQRTAQDVQKCAQEFFAQLWFAGSQRRGHLNELFRIAVHLNLEAGVPQFSLLQQAVCPLQPFVVEDQQTAVFEVWCSHPPAALQVAIEVVVDDAAQSVVGGVFGRTRTSGSAAYSSSRSCMASKTARESSP